MRRIWAVLDWLTFRRQMILAGAVIYLIAAIVAVAALINHLT